MARFCSIGGGLLGATQVELEAGTITTRACVPAYQALRVIGGGWALGSGGDDRGTGAIDFQVTRLADTQVASGDYAGILGGQQNTASGGGSVVVGGTLNVSSNSNSVVMGGLQNTASGSNSVIVGGQSNTASAYYSFIGGGASNQATYGYATIIGGTLNTASGSKSFIGGGTYNTASGILSLVGGGGSNTASNNCATVVNGEGNTASENKTIIGNGYACTASARYAAVLSGKNAIADKFGQHTQATGAFSASGDAQTSVLVERIQTTDATPTVMALDGSSSLCTIATDTAWAFRILVVARLTTADDESAGYEFLGVIDRNVDTTALVGSVVKTVIAEDTAAWDCAVTADDTNEALIITVTGEAGHTINWVARIELVEVTG